VSAGIQSRPVDATRHEVVLSGRLHAGASDQLRTVLDAAATRATVLLVDSTSLESIDAIALQAVVDVVKRLRPRGGTVVMFGVRPSIRRLLAITTVDRLVRVRESRDDAMSVAQ
jgi:anti-anti-sigma factor